MLTAGFLKLSRKVDIAFFANRQANRPRDRERIAVLRATIFARGIYQKCAIRRGQRLASGIKLQSGNAFDAVDAGIILTIGHGELTALTRIAQAEVDDAGNRIRTILCSGAIAKHFNALQCD